MNRQRLALAIATAALAIASIGVPVAAAGGAGATRVVDDDGRGNVASCDASTPTSNTIQKGVNASSAGDTVLVCPGDYREQVTVGPSKDGLTVRSKTSWAARILRPRSLSGYAALVHIRAGADRVALLGFRLIFRSGTDCGDDSPAVGVLVNGANAIVRGNRMFTTGAGTFDPCGYFAGVLVAPGGDPRSAPASAGIAYNTIKDYQFGGIISLASRAYIANNSVRFTHARSTCYSGPMPTIKGVQATHRTLVAMRRDLIARNRGLRHPALGAAGGEGSVPLCPAVGLAAIGPAATVIGNNVYSGTSAFTDRQETPLMLIAMLVGDFDPRDGAAHFVVRDNLAARAAVGIAVADTHGAVVERNAAALTFEGFAIESTHGAHVRDNDSHENVLGIFVGEDSAANELRNNDARGNFDVDCLDESTGRLTAGTANTWAGNLGDVSEPRGICRPPAR